MGLPDLSDWLAPLVPLLVVLGRILRSTVEAFIHGIANKVGEKVGAEDKDPP